jgi:hypothetical protein
MIIQFVKFNSHLSNAEVQRVMKERAAPLSCATRIGSEVLWSRKANG